MSWYELKHWIEAAAGLHMDALHIYGGVACQLAAALLLRRPLGSLWPWLVVAVAVAANEAYDLQYEIWPNRDDHPNRDDQIAESIKDLWNTLLLPSVLMLVARFWPALVTGSRGSSHKRAD